MKKLLLGIMLSLSVISFSGCQQLLLEKPVAEQCKQIDRIKACEATSAYYIQGKLQEKLNKALVEERISPETHANQSKKLQQANGLIGAWEAGRTDTEEALNLLEAGFDYLVSIGFSPREIFN